MIKSGFINWKYLDGQFLDGSFLRDSNLLIDLNFKNTNLLFQLLSDGIIVVRSAVLIIMIIIFWIERIIKLLLLTIECYIVRKFELTLEFTYKFNNYYYFGYLYACFISIFI
jgi:hypothetical protein